jgi:hypothetical protein
MIEGESGGAAEEVTAARKTLEEYTQPEIRSAKAK